MLLPFFRIVRTQWIGVLALVVAIGGAGYAATGGPVLLGKVNQANQPTSIRNTGSGPALELKVAEGRAPLTVNSSRLVRGLNAAQLGGKGPKAFAPASGSPSYAPAAGSPNYAASNCCYSKAQSDARYPVYTGAPGFNVLVAAPIAYYMDSGHEYDVTFLDRTFALPQAARVSVTFFGSGSAVSNTNVTITLKVNGTPVTSCAFSPPADHTPCDFWYSFDLAAKSAVHVVVELVRSGAGAAADVSGVLNVYAR